jgi:tetratricopeptide (TPR) repeat protein
MVSASEEKIKIFDVIQSIKPGGGIYSVVGDLFITDKGLFYVPLSVFVGSMGPGWLIGGLIGGLPGAIAGASGIKQQEQTNLLQAKFEANQRSWKQYGLSIQERIDSASRKDLAVCIRREDIKSISLKDNELKVNDNMSFFFTIDIKSFPNTLKVINEYSTQLPELSDETAANYKGINLPCPTPNKLIEILKLGQYPKLEVVTELLTQMQYLEIFCTNLEKLPEKDIEIVCKNITLSSPDFAKIMAKIIDDDRNLFSGKKEKLISKSLPVLKGQDFETGSPLLIWCAKRAEYFTSSGMSKQATNVWNNILKLNPNNIDALIAKGNLCLDSNSYEADKCFDKILKINPKSPEALYGKGWILYAGLQYKKALTYAEDALKERPHFDKGLFLKGVTLSELKRYDEAIQCYDEIIDASPQCGFVWYIYFLRGKIFNDHNRYHEAVKSFNKAIELNPNDPSSWFQKGVAEYTIGMNQEAGDSFEKYFSFNLPSENDDQILKQNITANSILSELGRRKF